MKKRFIAPIEADAIIAVAANKETNELVVEIQARGDELLALTQELLVNAVNLFADELGEKGAIGAYATLHHEVLKELGVDPCILDLDRSIEGFKAKRAERKKFEEKPEEKKHDSLEEALAELSKLLRDAIGKEL